MPGHGLAQTILLGGDGAGLMVGFALLVFSGLLRPFDRRSPVSPPQPAQPPQPRPARPSRPSGPEKPATPTVRLNAIELGLLAEFSLEQARAHEELLDDPSQEPDTRRSAAVTAAAWRERAREFHLQARHQGAEPVVPGGEHSGCPYTGPERRRQARRRETRRTGAHLPRGGDRRREPDRRQGDRRRPELAPR